MDTNPERNGVLDTCEELGIGFVPWGPLGEGYLTGKIDARPRFDPRTDLRSSPRFPRRAWQRTTSRRRPPDRMGTKKNATPAQIALAWLLAQKPFIVPIPGTRNIEHLNENLGALDVELTPAEVQTDQHRVRAVEGRTANAWTPTTWPWSNDWPPRYSMSIPACKGRNPLVTILVQSVLRDAAEMSTAARIFRVRAEERLLLG